MPQLRQAAIGQRPLSPRHLHRPQYRATYPAKHVPKVPPVTCPPRPWNAFEALAPHVIWAMDICYLYTRKHDGFERYLITIHDNHSRVEVYKGTHEISYT